MKDAWGEEYLHLVLRMEKHFEGFVDAYCGPEIIKTKIDKEEKQPLDKLLSDAEHLYETVPPEDRARRIFLEKQMTGIITTIRILQKEEIDYQKQVELFYDIKPKKIPDSKFEKQKKVLEDILGSKNLFEAVKKWRKSKEIAGELLREPIAVLHKECRRRTEKMISLPDGECVDFVLVNDKPWSGYNWYLGGYRSRVEINTDIPTRVTGLPQLVSHESYPGHHTEHSVKEKVLYRDKGFWEACVFVYNTPECLISEGIGNAAFGMIFRNREEVYQFLNETMDLDIDVDTDAAVSTALDELSACVQNASLMIHKENKDIPEVVEYLMDTGLSTRERAEKQVQFMTNPLFKAYIFNYYLGKELVSNALKEVDPRIFYENQMCPSNLKYFRKE